MAAKRQHSTSVQGIGLALALMLTACVSPIGADDSEPEHQWDPRYDENAPGYIWKVRGLQSHSRGDFSRAYSQFKLAAHWGDKFSQYNIGMLYLSGEGVDYDPTRAWAWMELSAERGYPQFVQVADGVWDQLSEWERERAKNYYQDVLLPKYGDEVAINRASSRMRREFRSATGSRLGAVYGLNLDVIAVNEFGVPLPQFGDAFYARDKWDFESIVAYETAMAFDLMQGTVTLRDLELLDDEVDSQERDADR